jgi:O-antigen/teichoic acid export membrane protein
LLKNLAQNRTSKKTFLLFSSQVFSLFFGFLTNMFLAKNMGAEKYGVYALTLAIISFLAIFYEFGYFASVSRLLAQTRDFLKERELLGASLVVFFAIAFAFVITILLVSLVVDKIYGNNISNLLQKVCFISWSFTIPFYLELMCKGTNQIELLSIFHFSWRFLFFLSVLTFYFLGTLQPLYVLFSICIVPIISFLFVMIKSRPSFTNLKEHLQEIHQEFKRYGRHIYIGRVIDVSTYQLDRLMIGYFATPKEVGFYNIANAMATPINTFSASLASTKFKDFANHKPISSKVLKVNLLWIILAVIGVNIAGYGVVSLYLGKTYFKVIPLLILLSLAVAFQAGYQPYNAWLASNGYGRELKVLSFIMGGVNLLGNILLIPVLYSIGASIASILGTLSYFLLSFLKYTKVLQRYQSHEI